MAATNFNTENRTYRQLLGNGLTYRVPPFQRDYSWGEEEWEDLWHDLLGTLAPDGEPAHYMGYLVLQTSDNRSFDVIDGQQRLTTLSLLVLAALRLLKRQISDNHNADDNRHRLEQLRATYIGYLDPVTLTARNKLSLNRNNNDYYRDQLVPLVDALPKRGFAASTHAMRKGFEWFENKLRAHVKGAADQGRTLAQFIDSMSDKLFFTVITVADELNAFKVFETLNGRGVRLSSTDLLKNWLFSVLAKSDEPQHSLDELVRRWENMVGRLGDEDFPNFLRMHWNSRQNFARHAELFKTIRSKVRTREAVFALLREMDEDIDAYLELAQPEGSDWPPEWREAAGALRMFSVRQPHPMLIAAKRRLSEGDFGVLLRSVVALAFRYNIIGGQHTGEQERVYHDAAMRLHRGEARTVRDALEALRPLYIKDRQFCADFIEKSIKTTQSRNAKIVRYILATLDHQAGGAEFDPFTTGYTIEHILPQRPDAGWEAFDDRDLDNFVYRLGNMTLLESGLNKKLGNQPYAEKRPIYQSSAVRLTQQLAEDAEEWTPDRLEARQKKLAALALGVWKITQLS